MEKMQMGKVKSNKLTILLKGLGRSGSLSPPSSPKKVSSTPSFSPAYPPSPKWALAADLEDQVVSAGRGRKSRVAPEGCFSVYVGPERKRFVVRTEHANHPLFRSLLEEAESEYGFCTDGPITFPCAVDLFHRVVLEMDADDRVAQHRGCAFSPRRGTAGGLGTNQALTTSRFRVG